MKNLKFKYDIFFIKLIFFLCFLFLCRLGNLIPLPYINRFFYKNFLFWYTKKTTLNILALLSGSFLKNLTVFSLGISSYISSTLLVSCFSSLMSKSTNTINFTIEYKKKNIIIRIVTLIISIIQSFWLAKFLFYKPGVILINSKNLFYVVSISSFTSGSYFLMWLCEQINFYIFEGCGSSIIIFLGIFTFILTELYNFIYFNIIQKTLMLKFLFIFLFFISLFFVFFIIFFFEKSKKFLQLVNIKGESTNFNTLNYLYLKIGLFGIFPYIIFSNIYSIFNSLIYYTSLYYFLQPIKSNQYSFFLYLLIFSIIFLLSWLFCSFIVGFDDITQMIKENNIILQYIIPGQETLSFFNYFLYRILLLNLFYFFFLIVLPLMYSIIFKLYPLNSMFGISLLIIINIFLEFVSYFDGSSTLLSYYVLFNILSVKSINEIKTYES